jgi:hypothetical protein
VSESAQYLYYYVFASRSFSDFWPFCGIFTGLIWPRWANGRFLPRTASSRTALLLAHVCCFFTPAYYRRLLYHLPETTQISLLHLPITEPLILNPVSYSQSGPQPTDRTNLNPRPHLLEILLHRHPLLSHRSRTHQSPSLLGLCRHH